MHNIQVYMYMYVAAIFVQLPICKPLPKWKWLSVLEDGMVITYSRDVDHVHWDVVIHLFYDIIGHQWKAGIFHVSYGGISRSPRSRVLISRCIKVAIPYVRIIKSSPLSSSLTHTGA